MFLGMAMTQCINGCIIKLVVQLICYCNYMNKWTIASLTTDRFIKNLVTFFI